MKWVIFYDSPPPGYWLLDHMIDLRVPALWFWEV